jgi:sulfur carrier protein
MKLIINGEEKAFESAANVADLITQLALKGDRIAVELNHDIVPRTNWNSATLHDGDRLEIVHFVGGGLE